MVSSWSQCCTTRVCTAGMFSLIVHCLKPVYPCQIAITKDQTNGVPITSTQILIYSWSGLCTVYQPFGCCDLIGFSRPRLKWIPFRTFIIWTLSLLHKMSWNWYGNKKLMPKFKKMYYTVYSYRSLLNMQDAHIDEASYSKDVSASLADNWEWFIQIFTTFYWFLSSITFSLYL